MSERSRLEWRCRRGTRELDLLLQNWLARDFEQASAAERQTFAQLLDWPDDALSRLLLNQQAADDPAIEALARRIRALPLSRP
jgi:antitoxin CptB